MRKNAINFQIFYLYSAGVGKTGVFIAIDTILDKLEKGVVNCIDVFGEVLSMRERKMNMGQTLVRITIFFSRLNSNHFVHPNVEIRWMILLIADYFRDYSKQILSQNKNAKMKFMKTYNALQKNSGWTPSTRVHALILRFKVYVIH